VGSNVYNLLAILGITALIRPLSRGDVSMASFGIMVALALLLLPVMRTGFRISRLEGVGLLAAYAGYLFWLVR
jgi:cation:H+ antiporter